MLHLAQDAEVVFVGVRGTQDKLDNFTVILTDESRVVTPFGRAINREMSASWRGRTTAASSFRRGVQEHIDTLAAQVKLIEKSETKLSGRSATIPVTVQNNLVQGVDHLVLRLTSTNETRLEIGGHSFDEQPITVSGGHSTTVKFTTSANVNGQTTVVAQLYTEDGRPYGAPVTFDVKVTEITATVMLVIGGGVLLLVLAGFRMYTQRKRAAAREVEEDAHDEAGEAVGTPVASQGSEDRLTEESGARSGADDPVQPSDESPDTAAESADPSGTGERVDR
ncbi:Secreted protein OS=Streptomyces aurantiogriseus OX=66870 GN=GCM10010251_04590 PE=4 SV=1 [Streptomyces aurantiogriseus]